jgi:hypothetical protein
MMLYKTQLTIHERSFILDRSHFKRLMQLPWFSVHYVLTFLPDELT